MITWPYMVGGLVLIVILATGGGYVKGRADGRVQQLQDSVRAYEQRGKIDNETNSLPARDLCIQLGGLPDDCDVVRGVDETPKGQ